MKKQYENKQQENEKQKGQKRSAYLFPKYGKTIMASSLAEAQEKMKKELASKESKQYDE